MHLWGLFYFPLMTELSNSLVRPNHNSPSSAKRKAWQQKVKRLRSERMEKLSQQECFQKEDSILTLVIYDFLLVCKWSYFQAQTFAGTNPQRENFHSQKEFAARTSVCCSIKPLLQDCKLLNAFPSWQKQNTDKWMINRLQVQNENPKSPKLETSPKKTFKI